MPKITTRKILKMNIGLMTLCAISSLFFVGCATQTSDSVQVSSIQENINIAQAAAEVACQADAICESVSQVSDDDLDGGIKKEYTVKGCKVTIYNDGPIKMVNEKTDQPCNAPIPKDHDFGGTKRVYQENGCTVTEYTHKYGLKDATMDCSERDRKK